MPTLLSLCSQSSDMVKFGSQSYFVRIIDQHFFKHRSNHHGLDDTIERRRGAKIKAKGIYRDPVRSSHSHFVKAGDLR